MFGAPAAAGVWQIGTSGPANGTDMSTAVARASASVTTLPASSAASAVPPRAAALTETSSLCDRVNVAMLPSKIGQRKESAESEISTRRTELVRQGPLDANFETFPSFPQDDCARARGKLRPCRQHHGGERQHQRGDLARAERFVQRDRRRDNADHT